MSGKQSFFFLFNWRDKGLLTVSASVRKYSEKIQFCLWVKLAYSQQINICTRLESVFVVTVAQQKDAAELQQGIAGLSSCCIMYLWASTGTVTCGWGVEWWSWSCFRFCVKLSGFKGRSKTRENIPKNPTVRKESEREKDRELLPGGKLSSLCLPWDSSTALNMPVIFNWRRSRVRCPPPLLEYFLSVRRRNGWEPCFLVTWWSPGSQVRDFLRAKQMRKREREGWAGCYTLTPAHTFTQRLPSLKFNHLRGPDEASDEAVPLNQMLRRQRLGKQEQGLVFVSCRGNESVGTAHRQTEAWGGGPCDVRPLTHQD